MLAILFSFFVSTLSNALEVTSYSSEKIILSSESCEELNIQVALLKNQNLPVFKKNSKNKINCSENIAPYLTKEQFLHYGQTSTQDGPNCFNSTMVKTKILSSHFESSNLTLHEYLTSPLCQKVSRDVAPKNGDIGIIYFEGEDGQQNEIHAFNYITDKLVYTKNGMDFHSFYNLSTIDNVLTEYDFGKKRSDIKSSECFQSNEDICKKKIMLQQYRCDSLENHLKKFKSSKLTESLVGANKMITELELGLSKILFGEIISENEKT
jgi:hypothetical protein